MRNITITIDEILDLVNCAEDYGFGDDVFYCTLIRDWAKGITPEEIKEYAERLSQEPEYGEEDKKSAIENLTNLCEKYK